MAIRNFDDLWELPVERGLVSSELTQWIRKNNALILTTVLRFLTLRQLPHIWLSSSQAVPDASFGAALVRPFPVEAASMLKSMKQRDTQEVSPE